MYFHILIKFIWIIFIHSSTYITNLFIFPITGYFNITIIFLLESRVVAPRFESPIEVHVLCLRKLSNLIRDPKRLKFLVKQYIFHFLCWSCVVLIGWWCNTDMFDQMLLKTKTKMFCVLVIQKEIVINHWKCDIICRYPIVFIDHCKLLLIC